MKLLQSVALCLLLTACGEDEKKAGKPEPMPLKVASPYTEMIEQKRTFTGRFTAVERVDVRPRVSGYIESIHFTEGQKIEEGELLMRIDPRLFDAEVMRAQAQLSQVRSALELAKENFARAEKLVGKRAISQEEVDIRSAELSRASADIQVAQARLESASLNREFAEIKAPISGIAGRFEVTRGNYVTGGSANSEILTTIVPHSPIYCEFEVDERQVLQFTRMFFEGKTDGRGGESPPVEIAVSDSEEFSFSGMINFSENELDPSTATLQLRAKVANENKFLTPGLFARVRIPIGDPSEELLVQESALGFDQSKRFAWVLKEDQTMERRYLEVGDLIGSMRIVKGGLTPEDQIAISQIQLIRPGAPVAPIESSMKPE